MKIDDLNASHDSVFTGWQYVLAGGYFTAYRGVYDLNGQSAEDVTADRIAHVDLIWCEEGDCFAETDMAALVELTDGTWAGLMAWCDTTGWGCQDDVSWKVAPTRELAISQCLDKEARARLGVPLPTDA